VNAPQGRIAGIQVPREGKHALYVWLADNAGNKDYRRYATVPEAFWYDVTPPTTTLTFNGTPGTSGWSRSAGTVNLAVQDAVSGPASTYYRINGGVWQTGTAFPLSLDGLYTVEYYSMDQAGNRETTRSSTVKIDTVAPISRVMAPTGYQENEIVAVSWSGSDGGSGVLYYDVEYRDGASGVWTAWRTATDETSGSFVGERGHVYYMRSRARDRAGNIEAWPPDAYGDVKFYIERIANGGFEKTPDFASWLVGGALNKRVVVTDTHSGGSGKVALLGNAELGPCYDYPAPSPTVPVGSAVISQTITVPMPPDTVALKLQFWYYIVTYDVVWSARYERWYDSFDVELSTAGAPARTLLLRDGNNDATKVGREKPPTEIGWKQGTVDLSAYAGQTVTLYFSINNRVDPYFNTWVYLDEVSIKSGTPAQKVFLPSVVKRREGRLMGAGLAPEATPVSDEEGPPPPR